MKRRKKLEADLDPAGTRHTRPGSKIADTALANTRGKARKRRAPTRKAPAARKTR